MAVVRIDLEVNNKGDVALKNVAGGLDDVGGKATSVQKLFNSLFEGIGIGAGIDIWGSIKQGAAAAVTWLTNASKAAIDYGGRLVDMKAQTGIAAESQQKLAFAAGLSGVQFDAVARGVGKMQTALVDTPQKFDRIGLSAATLRGLKPEEQFQAIAEKIAGIKDPAERSAAAVEIFGKSGIELLPVLTSNMGDAMRRAEELGIVMSSDVAGAADDLGDALDTLNQVWEGFVRQIGAAIVTSEPLHTFLSGVIDLLGRLSKGAGDNQGILRSWVDAGILVVAKGLVFLIDVVQQVMDFVDLMRIGFRGAYDITLSLGVGVLQLAKAYSYLQPGLAAVRDGIDENIRLLKGEKEANRLAADAVLEANRDRSNSLANVRAELVQLEKAVAATAGQTHKAAAEDRQQTTALKETSAAAAKHKAEVEKVNKELKELDAKADVARARLEALAAAFQFSEETGRLMLASIDGLKDGLAALPGEIPLPKVQVSDADMQQALKRQYFIDHAAALRGSLGSDEFRRQAAELGLKVGADAGKNTGGGFQLSLSGALAGVPQAIQGALEGGGDVFAAIGAQIGGNLGKSVGTAIGGPLGGEIGAILGKIGGKFVGGLVDKLFGSAEHKKVNDMRDSFLSLHGGFEKLQETLLGITDKDLVAKVFAAKTVKDFEAAVKEVQGALDLQKEAQEELQKTIEKYGFTLEELGPALQRQELDKIFGELIKEHELLSAAGIDNVAIVTRMAPAYQDMLDAARATGTAIPAQMRPVLQQLADMGLLVDAAGQKMTGLEDVEFTDVLTKGLRDTIVAVQDLVRALGGTVTPIGDVGRSFNATRNTSVGAVNEIGASVDGVLGPQGTMVGDVRAGADAATAAFGAATDAWEQDVQAFGDEAEELLGPEGQVVDDAREGRDELVKIIRAGTEDLAEDFTGFGDMANTVFGYIVDDFEAAMERMPGAAEGPVRDTLAIIEELPSGISIPIDFPLHPPDPRDFPGGGDGGNGGNGGNETGLARGDVIMPRPGGVVRRLAEAGQPELAAPVHAFSRQLATDLAAVVGAGDVQVYVLVERSGSVRRISRDEARAIAAGMGTGLIPVPARAIARRTS